MALHTELPIYKASYALFDAIVELIRHMNRDFRPSIGTKLRDECIEILTLVFRANTAQQHQDRAQHLMQLAERLQVAELLLRLSCDKHLISTGQYAQAVKLTQSIGRQATGWRKSPHRPLREGQGSHD